MEKFHPVKRAFDQYTASGGVQVNIVDGVVLPHNGEGQQVNITDLQSRFALRPSDVILSSYPKTGSTWLQQTVKLIRNNGVEDGRNVDQAVPLLEYLTPEDTEAMSSPRCFKTHVPFRLIPGGKPVATSAKYIYIYRNPKDAAVSLYHFSVGFQFAPSLSWDDFFGIVMDETLMPYGFILDHVQDWWRHRAASNILIVSYESMKKNLPQAVKTIADFLGYRLSPETISKIADQTTFKAMKKNPAGNGEYYDKYRREKSSPFMRKGVVGDWRNYFTEEQSARMDEECAKRFSGSGLEFDYGSQLPSSRL